MNGLSPRRGFTLFEVLLALAIAGSAMAVIAQVVWSGMDNARITQDLVQAELLAQSLMAELLSGIRPLESSDNGSFEEEADGLDEPERWTYSVVVTPLESESLVSVVVTVRADPDKPRPVEYSLCQWVLIPSTEEAE
ncbi:MAG TPA: hypothetical protein DD670_19620 [Planctomycetaceae bacterium]|nr:hypothetical protein [Planctomycetaceae bacterium]